eukprot:CAMPEP_0117431664 /NCGR_PEP_ID=MMETSP0758-20121206/11195_1 /TAXON_ID=63605 /ORGANISM="Percolomonas cosmopolitus, Strain AE-1 (ATCC 50343)" /LENGTH=171 /DNA_ID=CAMNT_0005220893 /DNA_START=364 /DNA_END=875 /DNA_ORIENTATION=-
MIEKGIKTLIIEYMTNCIESREQENKKLKEKIVRILNDFCLYWWGTRNFERIVKDEWFFNYVYTIVERIKKEHQQENYEKSLKRSILPLLLMIDDDVDAKQKDELSPKHYRFALYFLKKYNEEIVDIDVQMRQFFKKEQIEYFDSNKDEEEEYKITLIKAYEEIDENKEKA